VGNKTSDYKETDVSVVHLLADLAWDVAEEKIAEEKLRESEAALKRSQEIAHIGHWTWDTHTGHLTWSDEMCRIFGMEPGKNDLNVQVIVNQMIPPEDLPRVHGIVESVMRTGEPYEAEYRIRWPDGSVRYHWSALGERMVDGQGNVVRLSGVVLDITERKKAELALQSNEARYRIVAENTYDWEFWQDPHGRFLYISPSCLRITGHSADEFIADPELLFRIVHPDDRERLQSHMQFVSAEKTVDEIEYRIVHPEEGLRWIGHICQPIFDDLGNFMGLRGSNRDITERKRMEQLLQEWASFAQMDPWPVLRFNLEGEITLANVAAFRAFQINSFAERTVSELFPALPPDQARRIILENIVTDFEIRIGRQDYKFVVSGARGIGCGHMYGVDITERKHAEQEIVRAKEAAESANRELRQALQREQIASSMDSLTEIGNRRYFFEFAAHQFAVAQRYRQPTSIVMIDIDHFKGVNDSWGHQVGDVVLKRVAHMARSHLREADIIARYGGEEFIILLPNSDAQDARIVAERIRETIASYRFETSEGKSGITVSIGVAQMDDSVSRLDHLIQRADRALYCAKASGRNCVAVSN
jgi:diguanylate cyclase (GGDEF)-like protein/PAS domain S-box-containing protein